MHPLSSLSTFPHHFDLLFDSTVNQDSLTHASSAEEDQHTHTIQRQKGEYPKLSKKESTQHQRLNLKKSRIQEGIEEFQAWVHDLLLQGFKTLLDRPHESCEVIARRLVDTQLRGVSVWIQTLPFRLKQERPLDQKMAYITETLSSILATLRWYQMTQTSLPFHTDLKKELDRTLGASPSKKKLIASGEGLQVQSKWQVFALICIPENGGFTLQCWLRSLPPFCRFAVLHFFSLTRPKIHQYPPFQLGTLHDLNLLFYPSLWPLRAFQLEEKLNHVNTSVELPPPHLPSSESPSSDYPNVDMNIESSSTFKNSIFKTTTGRILLPHQMPLTHRQLTELKIDYERTFKREFKASFHLPVIDEGRSQLSWSWPNSMFTLQEALESVFTQKMYTPWRSWIPFQCKDIYLSEDTSTSQLLLVDQNGKGAVSIDRLTLPSDWSTCLTLLCPITHCLGLWNGVEVRLCVLLFEGEHLWMNDHQEISFEFK